MTASGPNLSGSPGLSFKTQPRSEPGIKTALVSERLRVRFLTRLSPGRMLAQPTVISALDTWRREEFGVGVIARCHQGLTVTFDSEKGIAS